MVDLDRLATITVAVTPVTEGRAIISTPDSFVAWLRRVPVGKPLSPLARSRIPEVEARTGRTVPVLSTETVMAAARPPRGK